jgi:hypothetical protein
MRIGELARATGVTSTPSVSMRSTAAGRPDAHQQWLPHLHACPSGTPCLHPALSRSTSPWRSPAPAGFSRQPAGGLCRDQSSHRRAASQGPRPTRQHAGSNASSLLRGQCATPHTSSDCGILHELVAAAHGEACMPPSAPGRTRPMEVRACEPTG